MGYVEDMRSLIQEWFASCTDVHDVVKLYHEIVRECEIQSEYMCEQLLKGDTE